MALVPTRQFYPMTFFDSLQTTQVRFFRYGSSITPRKFHFYVSSNHQQHYNLSSSSNPEHNPIRKNNNNKLVRTDQKNIQYKADKSLSSGNWIEKWNETHQPNRAKPAMAVLDYQTSESENEIESSSSSYGNEISGPSTSSSSSTMEKIVEKLKKFGYMEGERIDTKVNKTERAIEKGSVEDIFYAEEGILPNSRGGFSPESPFGVIAGGGEIRFPWEKPKEEEMNEGGEGLVRKRNSKTSLAELTLPEPELRRLRYLTFQKKHKTRIGGAGVTQEVVNMIHERWKESEIIRLQIQGPPALNMKRMHEILERKTGGLVVWRSGTSLSLYRGVSYEIPILQMNKRLYIRRDTSPIQKPKEQIPEFSSNKKTETAPQKLEPSPEEKEDTEKPKEAQYEDEMNQILDSLGPRFEDWPGADPLPVDADLLPGLVPNFQPPYRILPYGVRRSLGPREATGLRRLARVLPPHFALGRSRQLQGLSQAIIKLWQKSSIAKVALKRGVQLTTSERMAEELMRLTGGTLLSRNKDFLVFYRGKDFLSPEVTEALEERERLAISLQDDEEQARLRASAFFTMPQTEPVPQPNGTAGTLAETLDANAKWGKKLDNRLIEEVKQKAEMARHAELVRKLEKKLAFGERKLLKAERALAKVEVYLQPRDQQAEPESITDEERFMFRKLGLRMKAFLLLGRRGVFDGTVENMHLHWKYRELIKIVINAQTFEQVKKVALALEAESGGVLVSVDRVSKKKFAVIVYRGRDYTRPTMLRPKNLLTKRKALARSIEIQRQRALLNHISTVQSRVDRLRSELEQMDNVKDQGDESLYDTLDSAYPTSDDDDDDDDEAYVETYDNEDDDEDDKSIELIRNLYEEDDLREPKIGSGFSQQDLFDESEEEEEEEEEEETDYDLDY